MREILSTTNLSLVESLLIALEAEGIEAHTTNENAADLPFNPIHVFVVNDRDYYRAFNVVRSVRLAAEPGLSARRQRRAIHLLVLALVGVIALLCAEALARLHRRSA